MIPKIATGFCGGMSRTSGLCGALTGGIMALSMLFGRTSPQDPRDKNYALVAHLIKRFEQEFDSTGCTDLLGCDISTPAGSETFSKENLLEKICMPVVVKTIDLVLEAIAQQDRITHPLLRSIEPQAGKKQSEKETERESN